jgi:hypothetical protein
MRKLYYWGEWFWQRCWLWRLKQPMTWSDTASCYTFRKICEQSKVWLLLLRSTKFFRRCFRWKQTQHEYKPMDP